MTMDPVHDGLLTSLRPPLLTLNNILTDGRLTLKEG